MAPCRDWKPIGSPGSLAYVADRGGILFAVDEDVHEFTLTTGPTLAAALDVDILLKAAIELRDSGGRLMQQAAAAQAGADLCLQAWSAPSPGTYRLHLLGLPGTAMDDYRLHVYVNAATETGNQPGGVSNNTPATAQSIDSLPAGLPDAVGARTTIIGRQDNTLVRTMAGGSHHPDVLSFAFANLPQRVPNSSGSLLVRASGGILFTNQNVTLAAENVTSTTLFNSTGSTGRTATVSLTPTQMNTLLADGVLNVTITPNSSVAHLWGNQIALELTVELTLDLPAGAVFFIRKQGGSPATVIWRQVEP